MFLYQISSSPHGPIFNLNEPLLSCTHINRYGERLVIVASQNRRNRALFGPEVHPMIGLTDAMYCIIERIGR